MQRRFWVYATAVLVLIIAAGSITSAQEKKINRKDVPSAVLNSFHKVYPKAEIKGTSTETENGHKYYEIESVQGKKHVDLLLTENGKISEVEETISADELPADAVKNLEKKYKGLKIKSRESNRR